MHFNSIHRKKQGLPVDSKYAHKLKYVEERCDLCGWLGNEKSLKAHRGSGQCIKMLCLKKSSKFQLQLQRKRDRKAAAKLSETGGDEEYDEGIQESDEESVHEIQPV